MILLNCLLMQTKILAPFTGRWEKRELLSNPADLSCGQTALLLPWEWAGELRTPMPSPLCFPFFFFFLLLLCSRRQATSFIFISPFLSFSAWIQGEICSGDTGACVSCQQGSNSSAAISRCSPNTDTSASVLSSSLCGVYVAVCTWQTSYGSHQDFKLG